VILSYLFRFLFYQLNTNKIIKLQRNIIHHNAFIMPSYELSLMLRVLSKPELVSSLKRSAETIVQQGGVLRQFISIGTKPLPFKIRAHTQWHREGTYFLMKFDAPSSAVEHLNDEFKRDIDLIRTHVVKCEEPVKQECTLEEELKSPAYRKDVQQLVEESRKTVRKQFKQNSPGFDYYPFQK
jgi:small subunit ribosomal protein S6